MNEMVEHPPSPGSFFGGLNIIESHLGKLSVDGVGEPLHPELVNIIHIIH